MASAQEIIKDQPEHIKVLFQAINQGQKETIKEMLSAYGKNEGGSGGGQGQGGSCCSSCAVGKPCDSNTCPGSPPAMILPECYKGCSTISKCLMEFYRDARLRTDANAWLEYNKREIGLVHLNRNVGVAPFYNVPPFPLGTGQNAMLMQEPAQWLPYEPGFFKVDLTWLGAAANQAVTIKIWTGDYSVTSVSDPNADGLVQVGRDLTLSDFTTSPNDSGGGCCWFMPYPELFGCEESAIPNQRRVFFELRAGAMGASQITQFAVDLVKRSTKKFTQMCKQYGLDF